jgi:hypothetical protein
MSTSGRKGNWNKIAGTPKEAAANLPAKEPKKLKEEELSEHPLKKSGKTKSELHKPITKS